MPGFELFITADQELSYRRDSRRLRLCRDRERAFVAEQPAASVGNFARSGVKFETKIFAQVHAFHFRIVPQLFG